MSNLVFRQASLGAYDTPKSKSRTKFSKSRPKIRLEFPKVSVHTTAIPIVELHTLLHNQKCQFRPFLVELRLFFTSITHLRIGIYMYIVEFWRQIRTLLLKMVFRVRSTAYPYYIQYILKLWKIAEFLV